MILTNLEENRSPSIQYPSTDSWPLSNLDILPPVCLLSIGQVAACKPALNLDKCCLQAYFDSAYFDWTSAACMPLSNLDKFTACKHVLIGQQCFLRTPDFVWAICLFRSTCFDSATLLPSNTCFDWAIVPLRSTSFDGQCSPPSIHKLRWAIQPP